MEKENKKEEKKCVVNDVDDIKIMLKEAIEVSKKNQKDIKYIKRFTIWSQFWGVFKFLIILIPIIIGFIYLPSFMKDWISSYQEILIESGSGESPSGVLNLEKLIK
jgi:uncharacterized membrane protein YukC